MTDQIARPENAGLENDALEFNGPEQHAAMSLVQEHTVCTHKRPFRFPYIGIVILKR